VFNQSSFRDAKGRAGKGRRITCSGQHFCNERALFKGLTKTINNVTVCVELSSKGQSLDRNLLLLINLSTMANQIERKWFQANYIRIIEFKSKIILCYS
jgi:hypothetical protein